MGYQHYRNKNLLHLTPEVFRKDKQWHVRYHMSFPENEATLANARYCLDRAISIISKKQQYFKIKKWPSREIPFDPPGIYIDDPIYEQASRDSKIIQNIQSGYDYKISQIVTGFDPSEQYYKISGSKSNQNDIYDNDFFTGYLLIEEEA